MIILLLVWVALTIFSIIGFLFFSDILWDVFGHSDTIDGIAVIINFYLSNFLAMILLRNNSVIVLNKILIYLITGILLGVGEMYLGYYLIYDVFGFGDGVGFFAMLFLFFIVFLFGGPFFFFKKIPNELLMFIDAFFTGLQNNTTERFLSRAGKRRFQQEAIDKKKKIERDKEELARILAEYPIKRKDS